MFAWAEKINCFLHRIHPLQEWIKNYEISEVLFSYVNYLSEQSQKEHTKPPLVIFDIDDTLLKTETLKKFPMLEGMEPTITFFKFVQELGLRTVIITGRTEDRRDLTVQNLNKVHIKNYDKLIMKKNKQEDKISDYKLKERIKLSKKYTIIANVGDQMSDFEGGYNGKIIKISPC
jgi:predicted secreted acid phosphatase